MQRCKLGHDVGPQDGDAVWCVMEAKWASPPPLNTGRMRLKAVTRWRGCSTLSPP